MFVTVRHCRTDAALFRATAPTLARPVQAPRWAPTDTPNKPIADVEMPLAPAPAIDQCPEPPASTSPFETERLEKALQQLLDRLRRSTIHARCCAFSEKDGNRNEKECVIDRRGQLLPLSRRSASAPAFPTRLQSQAGSACPWQPSLAQAECNRPRTADISLIQATPPPQST